MKRLFLLVIAGVSSWWGYRKLRSHPRTAGTVAELERHSQRIVDRATDTVSSVKNQVAGKATDIAATAATGAQGAIDSATSKAHEALDAAAQKTRQAISPVQEKIAEARGDASATTIEPGTEHPAG